MNWNELYEFDLIQTHFLPGSWGGVCVEGEDRVVVDGESAAHALCTYVKYTPARSHDGEAALHGLRQSYVRYYQPQSFRYPCSVSSILLSVRPLARLFVMIFCLLLLAKAYGDEILSTQLLASAQNSSLPGQFVQRFICGFVAVTEASEHVLVYSLTV
jgi:hypothetical protein